MGDTSRLCRRGACLGRSVTSWAGSAMSVRGSPVDRCRQRANLACIEPRAQCRAHPTDLASSRTSATYSAQRSRPPSLFARRTVFRARSTRASCPLFRRCRCPRRRVRFPRMAREPHRAEGGLHRWENQQRGRPCADGRGLRSDVSRRRPRSPSRTARTPTRRRPE